VKETLRHTEAFEYYYSLGSTRNLPMVAQNCGVSITSVKKWSKNFNWQERVTQRDIEIGKKIQENTNNEIIKEKANYRKLIRNVIARFVKRMQENPEASFIEGIADLDRLIKLDLLLMGEVTNREEIKDGPVFTEAKIRQAYEALYGKGNDKDANKGK